MKEAHGFIRSIDIAEHLGVTKPSVSYATRRLRENGYITMDNSGLITLTDTSMEVAKQMYDRHKLLTEFFIQLGVDEETAKIVKDIFKKYQALQSLGKLQKYCINMGYKTNRAKKISKQALKNILTNDFYKGIVSYNDIKKEGNHRPIINKIVFGRVQKSFDK